LLNDINKTIKKSLLGKFVYKNIKMNLNFLDAIEETEIKVKFPLRIRIQGYSFLNKNPSETNHLIIEVYKIIYF